MRSVRFIVLFLLLLIGFSSWAQQSPRAPASTQASPSLPPGAKLGPPPPWTPHPIRDAKAVEAVQASLTALGGSSIIGQIQNCAVQGQVQAAANGPFQSGSVVWEVSGAESKWAFTSAQASYIQASGYGTPYRIVNGTAQQAPPHMLRAAFFPALVSFTLFRDFQDSNYSLRYEGTVTIGSENTTKIEVSSQASVSDTEVTPQIWYFDSTTNLPLRVEYRLPDDVHPGRFVPALVDLSSYQPVGGVLYPFQVALSIAGNPVNTVTVSSVVPNGNIAQTEFAAPAGGLQ